MIKVLTKIQIKHRTLSTCITVFLICFNFSLFSQTVLRSTFSVFSPQNINDSLQIAGGQVLNGESTSPAISHGYYPLNYSLLSISHPTEFDILVYPNPFSTEINIELLYQPIDRIEAQIFSIDGSIVFSKSYSSNSFTLNTATFPKGIYFLKVINTNEVLLVKKVIKQ